MGAGIRYSYVRLNDIMYKENAYEVFTSAD